MKPGFWKSPSAVAVGSYLGIALIGMLVLRLPASVQGEPLSMIDALFLSTSAVCVTGLSPVESLSDTLSPFGWKVLLALIQIGGMGLVLLGTLLFAVVGRRLSVHHAKAIGESYAEPLGVFALVRRVLLVTVILELLGAVVLQRFLTDRPGSWFDAAFHSVSAFCNAGFSTFPGGMQDYQTHWGMNLTIVCLILVGGLGFRVLAEVCRGCLPRREKRRFSLHTRIVLWTSGALILGGMALFLALEWTGRPLDGLDGRGLSSGHKVLAGLFQSVTLRTAGFNTVDIDKLRSATLLFFCLWMLIGGSPGSTAGGMKTVTWVLVLSSVWAQIRGRSKTTLGGRTILAQQVRHAMTVMAVYLLMLMTVVIVLIEVIPDHVLGDRPLLEVVFESASALGTVGLSTGITPEIPGFGKFILAVTMLVGRVGPLTLVLLIPPSSGDGKISYPEEPVGLG